MTIPADIAADFIVIESKIFGGFQVLFDAPTRSNSLHDGRQGRGQWGKDQVIGHFERRVEAATKHQPMAFVHGAMLEQRQDGPIKEPLPFGALALTESLPVLGAQRTVPDAGDIAEQTPRLGLHADHFGGRNGQGVGVALLLQPEPQVGAVSVDGIGDHPADRQASRLRSLDHAQSQFRFGLKGDGLRDVSGSPACEIVAPVFWQIQCAVDQGMPQGRHVGEEDAHLAIFDAPSGPAILLLDASRFGAPFGEATFIQDKHGEEGFGLSTLRQDRGRVQSLADQRAQFIAHPSFIPDRSREQALHAKRPFLSGMFSDLPAIFSRDLAHDGLQIEQGVLMWFGTSEVGSQALMQGDQGQRPSSYLLEGWSGFIPCGMVEGLHAFLFSDGYLFKDFFVLLECHIEIEKYMKRFLSGEWIRLQVPL